jgi:hypothetical protein
MDETNGYEGETPEEELHTIPTGFHRPRSPMTIPDVWRRRRAASDAASSTVNSVSSLNP